VFSNREFGEVDYPMITFQPGDEIEFNGGGCVQTGGTGKTWKSYLKPKGKESDHLYAGTALLPRLTQSFERISDLMAHPASDNPKRPRGFWGPFPNDPHAKADYILRLGYQDDQRDDNGYWNHDDGDEDQCKGVGPAFVEIGVTSGLFSGSGPLLSPHSLPFDLVWDENNDEDDNGLPLNPNWLFTLQHPVTPAPPGSPPSLPFNQQGLQPHFRPICKAAFSEPKLWQYEVNKAVLAQICTSMPVTFDANPQGLICPGDPWPGHVNFAIATYQGQLAWGDFSGIWPNDYDWSFDLIPPRGQGLAGTGDDTTPTNTIHMEFDYREVDLAHMPFWKDLVDEADLGIPSSNIRSFFSPPGTNGRDAVVISQIGLDAVHGGNTEGHPVFAMAVLLSENAISERPTLVQQKWAFFLRNFGDEGECSKQTWRWDTLGEFSIPLQWPDGATSVNLDGAEVVPWQDQAPQMDVQTSTIGGNHFTLIRAQQPRGIDEFGAGGTVTLLYTVPGGMKMHRTAERTQERPRPKAEVETEVPDLSNRIADPAVRAKYAAAVKALTPEARSRPAARVPITIPKTITPHQHVRGAASRGELVRARPVANLAKQKRDEEMFKILQTYQKDLKIEVPATPPAPPKPNAPQAPPR
jgi:hypothetical protein